MPDGDGEVERFHWLGDRNNDENKNGAESIKFLGVVCGGDGGFGLYSGWWCRWPELEAVQERDKEKSEETLIRLFW